MGIFYYDDLLHAFEAQHEWDRALQRLEALYSETKDRHILCSLIGFSWFYLVEGPCVSRKYENDPNRMAPDCWKKYVDMGEQEAHDDPFFLFTAGYTLSLHGFLLDEAYEEKGRLFMERCLRLTDDAMLRQLAENYLANERAKKHIPVENGKSICEHLFDGSSLLDGYFCEIYA